MSKYFLLIAAACCSFGFSSFESQPDCTDYKTGIFEIIDRRIDHHTIVYRGEKIQTEVDQKTGKKTKLSVDWIDDCTYKLTYLESEDQRVRDFVGKSCFVEITRIEGKVIHFLVELEGFPGKSPFKMIKID